MNGVAEPQVRRFVAEFAVPGWEGPSPPLYGRGHALLYETIRAVRPELARELHDLGERKPWAVSPLTIAYRQGSVAVGRLEVATWSPAIARLIEDGWLRADAAPIQFLGRDAVVLRVESPPAVPLASLLPEQVEDTEHAVSFVSPTFFGLGRSLDGTPHRGLLPVPGLVVSSWLRAWRAAGAETFGARTTAEWWEERLQLTEVRDLDTSTVVMGQGVTIAGFTGAVSMRWVGTETWGPRLFTALSRFAGWCATGAKTAMGFGQTRWLTAME